MEPDDLMASEPMTAEPRTAAPAGENGLAGSKADAPQRDRRSRRGRWILAAVLLAVALDLSRPPEHQASAALALGAIHLYQATASRWMPSLGVHCRFTPTCSHYAEAAIRQDGALIGGARALGRILRCGPWTPQGTLDPPRAPG